jgi:hypothetical protein
MLKLKANSGFHDLFLKSPCQERMSKAVITFTQSKRCHMIIRGHLIYSTYHYTYISNQITI